MEYYSENRKMIALLIALASAAVLISCTGKIDKPESVIDRMVKAYGGPEKTALLGTFVAQGFVKDQFSQAVTRGWPYDVWQRGTRMKNRVIILDKGTVKDIRYSVYDSLGTYRRSKRFDQFYPSPPELEVLKYRFPHILQWVQGDARQGKIIDDGGTDGICKLEFYDGPRRVVIGVSRDTWLLHDVSATLQADSTQVFQETYADYWEVDGVPIPVRYYASVNARTLYDFFFVAFEFGMELPDSVFSVTEEEQREIPPLE